MKLTNHSERALRIVSPGHAAFALILIGLGVLGLIKRDFTVIWRPLQKEIPARELLVYLCVLVSLSTGVGLLFRRTASIAARVLLAFVVAWFLAWRVWPLFWAPFIQSTWSCGQSLVMMAAAWVLFVWFAKDWDRRFISFATGRKGLLIARILFGLGLIPFGLAHFMYVKETTVLIPAWLPWHVGWAYFTGATFIAASLAVLTNVLGSLAVRLVTLQMGLFALVVWLPLVIAGNLSPFQWGEVVTTVALTAAGWVMADSYGELVS